MKASGPFYTAEYRPTDGIAIITGPTGFGSTLWGRSAASPLTCASV
jgi:hypothetical protein